MRVKSLSIFGSAVHGNFKPGVSDIDFLVEFETVSIDRFFEFMDGLQQLFHSNKIEMQITNESRKFLGGDGDELTDHFVTVTKEELNYPSVNICAGIRWLFRKQEIASRTRLKRNASWIEASEEYKGDLKGILNGNAKSKRDVEPFLKYLLQVDKCEK